MSKVTEMFCGLLELKLKVGDKMYQMSWKFYLTW